MKTTLLPVFALAATASIGLGQTTYTWNGSAGDGDWNNELNWDDIVANDGVPVDDNTANAGLSLPEGDKVVFDGPNMPTNNPGIDSFFSGGTAQDGRWSVPVMEFKRGGAISFAHSSSHNGGMFTNVTTAIDRQIWTIGDGITGAPEDDVVMTMTNGFLMMRHNNGIHRFTVNADGTLNVTGNLDFRYRNTRYGILTINGGSVNVTGAAVDLAQPEPYVEFTAVGGSFTAAYNANHFANLAAVEAATGAGLSFRSSDLLTIGLEVTDNGGTSFTVTAVSPPDPNYWVGTGGSVLDETSDNFTLNNVGDPLDVGTLAEVKLIPSEKVAFGDEYFHSDGGPSAVTAFNLTTAPGGIEIGSMDFLNNAVDYTVHNSDPFDLNGIKGATTVNLLGTGELTLLGYHSYTGSTNIAAGAALTVGDLSANTNTISGSANISNGGTLTLRNLALGYGNPIANTGTLLLETTANLSCSAAITGTGTAEKLGSGELTFPANAGWTGQTTVTEGTLRVQANCFSSVDIASGAVYEINIPGVVNYAAQTFTGTGTLRKTGAGRCRWTGPVGTFALDGDALIDVQQGDFNAGSNANENWTANLSDLHVEAGAIVSGTEANVRVDALTGGGTVTSGYDATAGYLNFTIGVANGSGTFDGVIADTGGGAARIAAIVKEGTGTQTLAGLNTYTGSTTVDDGVLTLADGGQLVFVPTANGVTNVVQGTPGGSGSPVLNLDGTINIDLSGAEVNPLNSWVLVDATDLTVNYGATFNVNSSLGAFTNDAGVWSLDDGLYAWFFDQSTGTLTYGTSQNAKLWAGTNGAVWDAATTANFTDNGPADPLAVVTFDVATATTGAAQFADEYYHSDGGPTAPAVTSLTATGGVETGLIEFFNANLDYTVDSNDANGIMGATAVRLRGGGQVTLLGTHAYSGATTIDALNALNLGDATKDGSIANSAIANDGVLVVTNAGAVSHDAVISGAGDLEKDGAGTLTLSADTTYTGQTIIHDGTVSLQGDSASTYFDLVAATSVVNIDHDGGVSGLEELDLGATTFSGAGTITKTGAGFIRWGGGSATFSLFSGALIDVQAGHFRGGSNANEVWLGNLSDLNVAAGATFNSSEANVEVDVLTGSGLIESGQTAGNGYLDFTFGVDNGTGTFDGVLADNGVYSGNYRKIGAGAQTLTGVNTYTGNTSVDAGLLTLAAGSSLTFVPTDNGVNNQVFSATGGGTVNLNGEIYLDLAATDPAPGNTWKLVDDLGLIVGYGGTFSVNSSLGAFTNAAGVWTLDTGGVLWTFDQSTGELGSAVGTPPGYSAFQTDHFSPAEITAGDADPNVDFDGGSLENGIEFVVGGDPTDGSDDAALAPTWVATTGGYNFTFRRTDVSASDNPGVEYGDTLQGFALAEHGVDGVIVTVNDEFHGAGIDQVIVFIPDTLAVDGRLFARLTVTPGL